MIGKDDVGDAESVKVGVKDGMKEGQKKGWNG